MKQNNLTWNVRDWKLTTEIAMKRHSSLLLYTPAISLILLFHLDLTLHGAFIIPSRSLVITQNGDSPATRRFDDIHTYASALSQESENPISCGIRKGAGGFSLRGNVNFRAGRPRRYARISQEAQEFNVKYAANLKGVDARTRGREHASGQWNFARRTDVNRTLRTMAVQMISTHIHISDSPFGQSFRFCDSRNTSRRIIGRAFETADSTAMTSSWLHRGISKRYTRVYTLLFVSYPACEIIYIYIHCFNIDD